MKITFYKYQGTGNDFVIIDNRSEFFPKENSHLIKKLCDRKFGIGADGLMLLENSNISDFKMIYFNADGNPGSMCGNGGRCITAFANFLKIFESNTTFEALGKLYKATISDNLISLKMNDVSKVDSYENHLFINTGSPHHIVFNDHIDKLNVKEQGKKIRYGKPYFSEGTNVNFVEQISHDTFKVRTYERGVEDETLSCGTGVTAVALAAHRSKRSDSKTINLQTLGGDLNVSFDIDHKNYINLILKGPATFVFKGEIEI